MLSCQLLLPSVLTDHYGGKLAEALLPFLLKKAEEQVNMRKCGLGSPYAVNFVLQIPSGRVYQFTGRPDFTMNAPYTGSVSRFTSTLKGVGEIQSPPSTRRNSALSQARIYAIGQFAKGIHTGGALPSLSHKFSSKAVVVKFCTSKNSRCAVKHAMYKCAYYK